MTRRIPPFRAGAGPPRTAARLRRVLGLEDLARARALAPDVADRFPLVEIRYR